LTTLDLESFGRRRDWRAVRISSFAPADRRWPGHRHPRHHPAALPRNLRSHHQRHKHHHRDPQPPRLLTRPAPVLHADSAVPGGKAVTSVPVQL